MSTTDDSNEEEKEDIWLGPMTKAHTAPEKSKRQRDNIKTATKNFDYTTIADRLRTVILGNDSHPTGVVKPVNGIQTLPTNHKSCVIKRTHLKFVNNYRYKDVGPSAT